MIVSLHLPKTAGTSFRLELLRHFGSGYSDDYADGGLSQPEPERHATTLANGEILARDGIANVTCVHGHFLPVKYIPLAERRELTFITWMREPLARMLSHYNYWQYSYDKVNSAPHHRMVIEQEWTLAEFCLSERFRNIYSQYLWQFAMDRFAFIGISEYYAEDIKEFSTRYLSGELECHRYNATPDAMRHAITDAGLRRSIREFHAADFLLYENALAKRESR